MKRLAVLISNNGTGSNLRAIHTAITTGSLHATICVVIANKEDAPGLQIAQKAHLPTASCPKKEHLLPLLQKYKPDYLCLAGWKQVIPDSVLTAYPNKILNIHPGLIPDRPDRPITTPTGEEALWNRQKYGNAAIQNFFDHQAHYAGSSVHFLTQDFDFGPVLTRAFEQIQPDDTIESLYSRLKKKEHQIYIEALQKLCNES